MRLPERDPEDKKDLHQLKPSLFYIRNNTSGFQCKTLNAMKSIPTKEVMGRTHGNVGVFKGNPLGGC